MTPKENEVYTSGYKAALKITIASAKAILRTAKFYAAKEFKEDVEKGLDEYLEKELHFLHKRKEE